MPDTLVAELETSTEVEEAPPSEVTEETASETTAQETDAGETETEDDTLTREEHERLLLEARDSIKAELEQQATQARQTQEIIQNRQRIAQAQQVLANRGAERMLGVYQWMQQQIEEGKHVPWNPKIVQSIADEMASAVVTDQFARIHGKFQQQKVKYGGSVSQGLERALEVALANGDAERAIDVLFEQMVEMVESKKLPELTEKAAKQAAEKASTAQATQKTKQQDAAARLGTATRGASSVSGGRLYMDDIDALPDSQKASLAREGKLEKMFNEARQNGYRSRRRG